MPNDRPLLPVASWYDLFAKETIAYAILDRLIYTSHGVELTGESL
jgi:DNA replication protein DnaC